jgi:hypothetical protein
MKLSKSSIVVLLIILFMVVAAVVVISANNAMRGTELSSLENAIAAVDPGSAQAPYDGPVLFTDHSLISPWAIDPGRIGIR